MDNDEKQLRKSGPTRRRLLVGLAGTPIIASLPSRPAWGQDCSISGMLSGTLSNHLHECPEGEGRPPEYWAIRPLCWPAELVMGTSLELGTMRTTNGGSRVVDPCDPSVRYDSTTGAFTDPDLYYFPNDMTGTSLDYAIQRILMYGGSSLTWSARFSESMMMYIRGTDFYPQNASCAILNALHPEVSYPYSALEICLAMVTVVEDTAREGTLANILNHFNQLNMSTASVAQRSCS